MFEFEPGLIIWTSVSFAILVWLMYRVALPPLLAVLKEREDKIAQMINSAAENQKKAEELADSSKKKLAESQETAKKIIDAAKQEADHLREEWLSAAKREADLVMLKAREDLEREKNLVFSDIRESAANLVVAATGKVLRKEFDAVDNKGLIEEAIKECLSST